MKDTSFWFIVGLIGLFIISLTIQQWEFTSKNTFGNARFQDEVVPRQTEVPEVIRKYVSVEVENGTEFLELRVGSYVQGALGSAVAISLITFLFLGIRQRRLMKRLCELEERMD